VHCSFETSEIEIEIGAGTGTGSGTGTGMEWNGPGPEPGTTGTMDVMLFCCFVVSGLLIP
jgi:hypothetical protein